MKSRKQKVKSESKLGARRGSFTFENVKFSKISKKSKNGARSAPKKFLRCFYQRSGKIAKIRRAKRAEKIFGDDGMEVVKIKKN